jgi:hypothetical protein
MRRFHFVLAIATALLASVSLAQLAPTAGPYKATKTKVGGEGGTDYIYADADAPPSRAMDSSAASRSRCSIPRH